MRRWPHNRPGLEGRARLGFRNRSFKFSERMDPLFLGVLAVGALLLGGLWFIGVRLIFRMERTPSAQVQLIADERLLTNVRDGLPQRDLLDAVYHQPESRIYLSQEGGQLHSYDPQDGLWYFDKPYGHTAPVNPRFVMLQSGCGGLIPCPDGDVLWAIGEDGGLVRKRKGKWELVVSDTAFLGADSLPITQENLLCAAISADGIWLALGTRNQGFGLYSLDRHRWVRLNPSFYQPMSSLVVNQVVWWRGGFWFGGPNGLVFLDMADVSLRPVADIDGEILDLDADPDGDLWILERKACATPGQNCQRIWGFTAPHSQPEIRLEEADRYSELNLARQHFAMQSGTQLWLAGETGVYGYDTSIHRWERYHAQAIGPTLALPDYGGFYFGFAGGVGWRDSKHTLVWPLEGERFAQLTAGSDGEVLGLTFSSGVYEFRPGADHRLVFSGKGTALNPQRFSAAVAMGDQILFSGPDGALLHDVRRRTYRDFKDDPSMAWLTEDASQLLTSGEQLYALGGTGKTLSVKTISLEKVRAAEFNNPFLHEPMVGPASGARAWARGGIGFLDGLGRGVHVDRENITQLTGAAVPELDGERLIDVVSTGRDLLFATNTGLRNYDKKTRAWSKLKPLPSGSPIVELTQVGGEVYMRDKRNRLVREGPFRSILIGEGGGSAIGDRELTDVWGNSSGIYLAGAGHLEYYDLGLRGITGRWRVPSGDTRILGEAHDRPLALTNGSASWGDQVMGPLNERVINLFNDNQMIWTVRERNGGRYLRGLAMAGEVSRCFFRRPTMGADVEEVTDAGTLGDGVVVVATNDGLRFYDPRARSWFLGPKEVLPNGGRIFQLGDYLLFLERDQGQDRHWLVARRTIRLPDSCSDERVVFQTQQGQGRGTAVDESRGIFAWIETNGAVSQWRQGKTRERLPAEPNAPRLSDATRWVFQEQHQALLLVADGVLWRYTLASRVWEKVGHRGGGNALDHWNLTFVGDVVLLSAVDQNGTLYLGELAAGAVEFDWVPVYEPNTRQFGQAGSSIVDVQVHPDGTWAFLLRDRIQWYNPFQRRWVGHWRFPTGTAERDLRLSFGRWVCIERETGTWWVGRENRGNPSGMAGYAHDDEISVGLDEDGRIWQLHQDGRLQNATLPVGATYKDFSDIGPKPFMLESESIGYAITWQGLLLFVLGNKILAYDETSATEKRLPNATRNLVLTKPPLLIDGDLWLLAEDRLVVLQQSSSGQIVGFRFADIAQLEIDRDGLPWVRDKRGWRFWRNGTFQRPKSPQGIGADDRIWVVDGMPPMALTADGLLLKLGGSEFESQNIRLAKNELPQSPWGLVAGDGGKWWAWGGFGIARLGSMACGGDVCLRVEKIWRPSGKDWARRSDELVHLQYTPANGLLAFTATHLFVPSINSDNLTVSASQPPKSQYVAENDWADLKEDAIALPNGTWVYNPIIALENKDVSLIAKRADSEEVLAERGAVTFAEPPALDVGWLAWDRNRSGFQVNTEKGKTFFAAADFVAAGQLLFEEILAVVASGPQTLVVANRHGLWRYKSRHLGLNNQDIEFLAKPLTPPVRAQGDRFSSANREISFDGKSVTSERRLSVKFGDIVLGEAEDGGGVAIAIGGKPLARVAESRGFPWDRNRRQLVWNQGRLQMWSDAGLHDLESLENFRAMPASLSSNAVFEPDTELGIWVGEKARWYQLINQKWQRKSGRPGQGKRMVDRPEWVWTSHSKLPEIELKVDARPLAWIKTPRGPGFAADQCYDAIAVDNHLIVSTQAWMTSASTASDLGRWRGLRRTSLGSGSLDRVRIDEADQVIARLNDGRNLIWNKEDQQFQPAGDHSRRDRLLWANDRLRFTREKGQLHKAIRMDNGWVAFAMVDGRFPFDVITSIASSKGGLWLGTAAGLQIYQRPTGLRLERATNWFSLASDRGQAYSSVRRIEQAAPDQPLRIFSENQAFQAGDQALQRLPANTKPGNRLRYISTFWHWTQSVDGKLSGRYFGNKPGGWPVRRQAGRFEHDRLLDMAESQGKVFMLWRDGHLSVGSDTSLAAISSNYQLARSPRELLVLERDTLTANKLMTRGVYALTDSMAWRFEQDQWLVIEDVAEIASLNSYTNAPPIYQREHLRLSRKRSNGRFTFEYSDGSSSWRTLPWTQQGRLALDRWHSFHSHSDTIWAATALGLVSFSRDGGGNLILQPHHFLTVNQLTKNQSAREISDLKVIGDQLWVRCNEDSKRVYVANLAEIREAGFQLAETDPFAEGIYVDGSQNFWEWRWLGRHSGSAGVLRGQMAGEQIDLAAGRFHFDGVTSMALLQPGVIDLTTETGGWFQTDSDNFSLSSFRRPNRSDMDPRDMVSISVGRSDGTDGLCLKRQDESFWWWVPGKTPEAVVVCNACDGTDGFWQYESGPDGLRITSDGRDGSLSERLLERGRFLDDRVLGMPIAGQDDAGEYLLMPTRAGILRLNEDMELNQLFAPPFAGLPEGQAPSVLVQDRTGGGLYLAADGFRQIDQVGGKVAGLPGDLPRDAEISRAIWETADILRMGWQTAAGKGWHLFAKEGLTPRSANHLFINVASHDRFVSHRLAWGDPDPWLVVKYEQGRLHLSRPDKPQAHIIELPQIQSLLRIQPWRDRLFILGQSELVEVRLDLALDVLFSQAEQKASSGTTAMGMQP